MEILLLLAGTQPNNLINMINIRYLYTLLVYLLMGASFMLISCADDISDSANSQDEALKIYFNLHSFQGEPITRTTADGLGFESTDKFRMEIICPHTDRHQYGEPWSTSYHNIALSSASKVGDSWVTNSTVGANEVQGTTYIYTAQNTIADRIFVVNEYRYSRPSNFFYADQSKLDQFKKSDVVWAQAIRQTGAREVHLNFEHKVAKLDITIDDTNILTKITENTVLTLEGMPDIDGAEIVVGDYYADDSYQDESYSYRQKASCNYENNGKVIGIEVIDDAANRSKIWPMSGNPANPGGKNSSVFNPNSTGPATPVPNTGTYTAYHDPADAKHFLLYVPVCNLDPEHTGENNAMFWIREGSTRYSAKLDLTDFEAGHCYSCNLTLGEFVPDRAEWTVTVSSADGDTNGAYIVDGDNSTFWQSAYEEGVTTLPQSVEIDMKKTYKLSGLTYRPRQDEPDGEETGLIKDYYLYYKETESEPWHLYTSSKFQYDEDNKKAEIDVPLYFTVWARYLKLEARSEVNEGNQVAISELGIKAVGVK